MTLLLAALLILWLLSGFGSFVYWWTKNHDLRVEDVLVGIFISIAGPLNWITGWAIHGDSKTLLRRVVLKKRGTPAKALAEQYRKAMAELQRMNTEG